MLRKLFIVKLFLKIKKQIKINPLDLIGTELKQPLQVINTVNISNSTLFS